MITSLCSKCMTSSYHHDRQVTSWQESAYGMCRRWVIAANSVPYVIMADMCDACNIMGGGGGGGGGITQSK